MKIKYFLIGIFILLYATINYAQQTTNAPLNITSEKSDINRNEHIATFSGSVVLTHGETHLTADRLLIYLDEHNQIKQAFAIGNPAKYWTTNTTAMAKKNGEVNSLFAEATTIKYFPLTHKVSLIGNAKAIQNRNSIQGPNIEYDLKTGNLISTGNKNGRTSIVIENTDSNWFATANKTS